MRWRGFAIILFLFVVAVGRTAGAETFRLGILHGNPEIFDYEISVMRLALKYAPGEHELEIVPMPNLTQKRVFMLMEQGQSAIDVFFSGYAKWREDYFLQVDIPITRGLLGYRVFVIRREDRERLAGIRSLDDFRRSVTIGSGIGWLDTDIFRAAGFTVATGQYESLWKMLGRRRFDAFNRGIQEVFVEMKQRGGQYPNLMVDDNLMAVYRFDHFFYVKKEDQRRHDLIEQGLKTAYENGAFMKNFYNHPMIKAALGKGHPQTRRSFHLPNPFLSEQVKAIPEKYWQQF
ncbi:hypothetical protein [Aestuariispira ectoiniformans]|uniref:hypothetical protein n=1 Tax=Aestuariispira ectoiniformans TaxID=2775080 RepID=UPI00223BF57B|nr:hypothetical protein [Aestuariispira ectoiniformans]